jgi:hypothetical protein
MDLDSGAARKRLKTGDKAALKKRVTKRICVPATIACCLTYRVSLASERFRPWSEEGEGVSLKNPANNAFLLVSQFSVTAYTCQPPSQVRRRGGQL